ncbi:hypothetical protein LEMLEM_LOCUS12078 [Lemmus lemmus]
MVKAPYPTPILHPASPKIDHPNPSRGSRDDTPTQGRGAGKILPAERSLESSGIHRRYLHCDCARTHFRRIKGTLTTELEE